MTFPFGQPVVLIKRVKGQPDQFGNDTWTTIESTLTGAFDPGTSVEQIQGQDLLVTQPSVFLPPDANVVAVDAVRVGSDTYEVDGAPSLWVNPYTGWRAGLQVRLRRATG